jgi:hypothetical protein
VGVSSILRGGEGESRWPGLVCRVGGGENPIVVDLEGLFGCREGGFGDYVW